METMNLYKNLNRDMSNEELMDIAHQWRVELEFLEHELLFLKNLLDSNIYEKNTMNLFENLQLFKGEIDNLNEERANLLDKVHTYHTQLSKKIECDDLSCDMFYMQLQEKMAFNITTFLDESKNLKLLLFEYIQSVILK